MKTLCGQPVTDEEYEWAMAQDPGSLDEEIKILCIFEGRARAAVEFLENYPDGVAPPGLLLKYGETLLGIVERLEVLVAYRQSLQLSPNDVQ